MFKEVLQLFRNKVTLISLLLIPVIQIFISGIVLNNDPKHLTTALLTYDNSVFTRSLIKGMENTKYFCFVKVRDEIEAR